MWLNETAEVGSHVECHHAEHRDTSAQGSVFTGRLLLQTICQLYNVLTDPFKVYRDWCRICSVTLFTSSVCIYA